MQMSYELRTRVIFEQDALAENATLITSLGSSALVVLDAHLEDTHPAIQETLFCLEYNGIHRTLYHHTRRTAPNIANLEAGAALARETSVDFIVAIGGISTLETAKAIALLAAQDIDEATLLVSTIERAIPVICIPTMPGGGTEVTDEVHIAQTGLDHLTLVRNRLLLPYLALIDPRYMANLSEENVIECYLHTLGRAVEALASEKANPISDCLGVAALGGMSDLFDSLTATDKSMSLWHDEHLLLAANQTGLAIAMVGANTLEALATPLTYVKEMSLGKAYGLMIPPFIAFLLDRHKVVGDVVLQSLYLPNLDALQEFLWDILGEVEPLSQAEYEQVINAAQNTPGLKNSVLSLDYKDIASCYAHLVADTDMNQA